MNLSIWPCLLILAGTHTMAKNPLELNHFYVALDSATYSDIESAAFLKQEFAAFEKRTTTREDRTYTGIYFYGTRTYFEFFDSSHERRAVGETAVAFGVDAVGAMPSLDGTARDLITRGWQGAQIPWFYRLSPTPQLAHGLESWIMEYHPGFLDQWRPGPGQGVTRQAVLARYKSVLEAVPSDPYLEDVTGLTLALPADEMERMGTWLAHVKPALTIRMIPMGHGPHGLRSASFRLRRSQEKKVQVRFGARSVLTLRPDKTAIWEF